MNKKKVLMINTVNTGFTGITSVITNYVRKTYQTVQYDFVLCGRVEESFKDELNTLGKNVFIPPCSRVRKPITYSKWLERLIKENQYDVVHVHGNSGTMFFDIHAAKKAGVPIRIAHSHNSSAKYKLVHYMLKPLLNREITHAIACSDLAGKWLFNREYMVLPNGIDIDRFRYDPVTRASYRKEMEIEDCFVIGHVALMDTVKNHMYLLEVFENFVCENSRARLLLIGDGRLRPDIEQYISEHDLGESVLVLGKRADVAELYQCMDAFVLPSLYEGLPVTLVEAQTAGLPCLVSDVVTRTVNITGNVQYIGIQDSDMRSWMQALSAIEVDASSRDKWAQVVAENHFDIKECVAMLKSVYQVND